MMGHGRFAACAILFAATIPAGCAARASVETAAPENQVRRDAIARARVWASTNVSSMDMRRGPGGAGSFMPHAVVDCTYVERDMGGATPKLTCRLDSGEEVKVKYGRDNGEVYAEVAATRLLWALGFGADAMYPVRVRCRACPYGEKAPEPTAENEILILEPAAIERKMRGAPLDGPGGQGWAWSELDGTDPRRGGASVAERDALKLLAAMLQHTDSKKEQQRLVCLEAKEETETCRQPFLLISDLGKTFGRANLFNRDGPGSTNLKAWSSEPIWAEDTGCRVNLNRSLTGSLDSPVISEAGRRFLTGLLKRLTDQQLRDLFTVARFPLRAGAQPEEHAGEIEEWVQAFKHKVGEIEQRQCGAGVKAS
jgi:hypothetical protein